MFSWRTALIVAAMMIVAGTALYSRLISRKLEKEEREKISTWVEAQRTILFSNDPSVLRLASGISFSNEDIPVIESDEHDRPTGNFRNLDTARISNDPLYLQRKLQEFRSVHKPFLLVFSLQPFRANKYYYGESALLKEVRYYPYVQLLIVALFVIIGWMLLSTSHQHAQSRLWAGMAKETAHQLGTPVSSLQGWIEVLKENPSAASIADEMSKDVVRLALVTDRFGKIGSKPSLEPADLEEQVQAMIAYMKKRAGRRVDFHYTAGAGKVPVKLSPPLFDWVIENLIKNALDAMEGQGRLDITLTYGANVCLDVADSGKGMTRAQSQSVFKPGYTTKKRGWGLGLTLAKRIIEEYHGGRIFMLRSEPGLGTTFRIELPAA